MHDISIIGGGISGLSAAIALKKYPLGIKIFEKNNVFSTSGAGIQLGPNGTRVLSSLGLLEEVLKISAQPERLLAYDIDSNKNLCGMKLGLNSIKKYGFPYLTVLRSDLHNVLEKSLVGIDNIELIKGFKIKSIQAFENKVSVVDNYGKTYQSSGLIACDGIHSQIKKIHFKKKSVHSNESTAYRTLIKNDCERTKKHSKDIKIWFGKSFHAITYPVGVNKDINVVVVTKQTCNQSYGWSNPCHLNEFFSFFLPYPDVEITKLIKKNLKWFKWPIYKCEPIKTTSEMTKNSIILLGDAAHYMKPHLAQGACMALEDSNQLKYCLKKKDFSQQIKWNQIFSMISDQRLKRITKVQKKSIQNGFIFQCGGIVRVLRNFILIIFGRLIIDQKWLFKDLL